MKRTAVFLSALLVVLGCSRLSENPAVPATHKCTVCHGIPPATRVHDIHVGINGEGCSVCHAGSGVEQASTDSDHHNDGSRDVKFAIDADTIVGEPHYDGSAQTCAQVYCHGSFPGGTSGTVSLSDSAGTCDFCHIPVAQMQADGHHGHTSSFVVRSCDRCHTGYSQAGKTVVDSLHINGKMDPPNPANCSKCPH